MSLRPRAPGATAVPTQNRLNAVLSAGRREMQRGPVQQPSAPVGDIEIEDEDFFHGRREQWNPPNGPNQGGGGYYDFNYNKYQYNRGKVGDMVVVQHLDMPVLGRIAEVIKTARGQYRGENLYRIVMDKNGETIYTLDSAIIEYL